MDERQLEAFISKYLNRQPRARDVFTVLNGKITDEHVISMLLSRAYRTKAYIRYSMLCPIRVNQRQSIGHQFFMTIG